MKIRFSDMEDDFGVYEITHDNKEIKLVKEIEGILKTYKRICNDDYNIDTFFDILRNYGFTIQQQDVANAEIYF